MAMQLYSYVYVIAPLGVLLLVYKPEAQEKLIAPDGEGLLTATA